MQIEAIDLTKDDRSLAGYLTKWLPIIHKMTAQEIVGLFEGVQKAVELEKMLVGIKTADALVQKLEELKAAKEYPPTPEINKLLKQWKDKKIEEKPLLESLKTEIKNDLGIDVSSAYIKKVMYNLENFKEDKNKLMKYVTNIILRGAGHGVISEIETLDKLASLSKNDELLVKVIVAENLMEKK